MRILGPPGGAFVITILDISKEGLRVRCSRPLERGTRVELKCRQTRIAGEVRYARGIDANEFHVGIQATSVSGETNGVSQGTGEIDLIFLFPDLTGR